MVGLLSSQGQRVRFHSLKENRRWSNDPPPFIAAAALDVANPVHMDGGIRLQFPSLTSRILRQFDGKRLFHAAAEDRIAVFVLFDKEVLSWSLITCLWFAFISR